MKTKILIPFALLAVMTGCTKEKLPKLKEKVITITGITPRDANATLTGAADSTDWTTDLSLPDAVNTLMTFQDTLNYSGSDTSTIQIVAYPNPFDTEVALNITSSKKTILKFAIVDDTLNIYSKNSLVLNPGTNSFVINLNDATCPKNTLYRMYYACYDKNKVVYMKGHGDLQKK